MPTWPRRGKYENEGVSSSRTVNVDFDREIGNGSEDRRSKEGEAPDALEEGSFFCIFSSFEFVLF